MRKVWQKLTETTTLLVSLLLETYENWRNDRTLRLGAGLAYYGLFGVVPLLSVAVTIASFVFSDADIRSFIDEQLQAIFPGDSAELSDQLGDAIATDELTTEATVLSLVSGVIAASFLFTAMQDALSVIWDIPVETGIKKSLRRRMLAFLVVLLSGALLIAGLVVNALLLIADSLFPDTTTTLGSLEDLVASAVYWALGIAALAGLWQMLIRKDLDWRGLIATSAVTVFAMVVATWVLAIYFEYFGSTSLTGVVAAIFVVLFWLYVEAQILLVGSQLLKSVDDRIGDHQEAPVS